jgi:drug/metabolite transporter (DMT)-like permease
MKATPSHAQAVCMMLVATLLWSIAGVVTRQVEAARGVELTFWRSAFNALALIVLLSASLGPATLWRTLRQGGRALWISGLCWAVMFTAFMMALMLTSVANVLVTLALGPLFTALASRAFLGHQLAARSWAAIALAGAGIAWMYGRELLGTQPQQLLGSLVALGVPIAGAANWTLSQHLNRAAAARLAASGAARANGAMAGARVDAVTAPRRDTGTDLLCAVLIGALLSAVACLPLAWPLAASAKDVSWLALLGVFQLAIPCLMAVVAARALSAPEVSLLALLEVIFGVLLAWLGANEVPQAAVLQGGAVVLLALALNEGYALWRASSIK